MSPEEAPGRLAPSRMPSPDAAPHRLRLVLPGGSVPLVCVDDPPATFVLASDRSATWPSAILRTGVALVERDGVRRTFRADLVTDPPARARILARFREATGEEDFRRWFGAAGRLVRLTPEATEPRPRPDAAFDRWLRAEFDAAAPDYRRQIESNPLERYLRTRSVDYLRRHLADRHRLLELGSGPGVETLPLLEDGHEIVAVDISEPMLAELRERARAAHVAERLTAIRLRIRDLDGGEIDGEFEGAYSTFGALSCEGDLDPVRQGLARKLRVGAPFVAGAFNRLSAFELAGYGLTGAWRRAFGRLRTPMRVGDSRFSVDCYPRSPSALARAFAPDFAPHDLVGLSLLVPPPELEGRFGASYDLERLGAWDRRVGAAWPFRHLGDHFLVTLERRSDGGRAPAPGAG